MARIRSSKSSGVADSISGILSTAPDVVLLDVHMPDGGGVAVLRGVTDGAPRARLAKMPVFLALSVSDAAEDVIAVASGGNVEPTLFAEAITRHPV